MQQKIICWDLDETLIWYEFIDGKTRTGTRPGIKELLKEPQYVHVVTTASHQNYAKGVLDSTELSQFFAHVFAADKIDRQCGKLYGPVMKTLGLSEAEALENIVVVGNSIHDAPVDVGLVFVYQPNCVWYDTFVTREILNAINGKLGFRKEFDKLLERTGGRVNLACFSFNLRYWERDSLIIPAIENIQAEKYKRQNLEK